MKEQLETVEQRIKFTAGDSDEARKTATGHSCGTLAAMAQWTSDNSHLRSDTTATN